MHTMWYYMVSSFSDGTPSFAKRMAWVIEKRPYRCVTPPSNYGIFSCKTAGSAGYRCVALLFYPCNYASHKEGLGAGAHGTESTHS